MFARMVGLLCVAALATSTFAQTTTRPSTGPAAVPVAVAPAVSSSDGPTVGTVNGTDVYVRSDASINAYPCAKVSHPTTVTIVGKLNDWYEILPVADTFSVVDKAMVQLDAGNQTGTAKQDTFARAGGMLRPNDFTRLQAKIKAGQKVKITGEIGDYYRIVPPEGAHLFINARYVDLPGGAGTARKTDETGTAPASLQTTTIIKKAATTSAPAINPEVLAQVSSLQAVEKKLQEAFKDPTLADKIDVQGLLDEYQALKVTGKGVKEIVDYRIKFLQNILDRRKAHQETEALITDVLKNQSEIDKQIAAIVVTSPANDLPAPPTAQGVLVESVLFTGGAAGAKKYTLRDPVFQRIDAYVQCTTGAVDLQQYVGKAIAVKGTTKFEPSLKLNVVEVQEVIVLNDKFELPPPNKPTIIEPPAPATKPIPAFKSDAAPKAETKVEAPKPADAPKAEPPKAEAPKAEPAPEIILEPLPAAEAAVPSVTSKPLPPLQD